MMDEKEECNPNETPKRVREIARFIVMATFIAIVLVYFIPSTFALSIETFQTVFANSKQLTSEQLSSNFSTIRNNIILIVGLVGTPFLVWRTWLASEQTKTAQQQAETARDRSYTELFTKAVEQLGTDKLSIEYEDNADGKSEKREKYVPNIEVRIGAIYALERIMNDSNKDAPAIVDTLAAYIRENCGKPTLECEIPIREEDQSIGEWVKAIKEYVGDVWPPEEGTLVARARTLSEEQPQVNRADIKTALTVLGRRPLHLKDPEKFQSNNTKLPDLRSVNFQGWDLAEFDLSHCNLSQARMQGATLRGAEMQGANLSFAEMQGADVSGAEMQGTNLVGAEMQGANLQHAKMQGADLFNAEMQGADLFNAKMHEATLSRAQMQGASLDRAEMQGADLRYAKMQGAKLGGAEMQGADLSFAKMQGAILSGAHMQGAKLGGAEMQGADLSQAQMDEIQITSARKTAASVIGFDFTKTNFELDELQSQLPDMFGHKEYTKLPDGMAPPEHWSEADMTTDEGRAQYDREWADFKKKMRVA